MWPSGWALGVMLEVKGVPRPVGGDDWAPALLLKHAFHLAALGFTFLVRAGSWEDGLAPPLGHSAGTAGRGVPATRHLTVPGFSSLVKLRGERLWQGTHEQIFNMWFQADSVGPALERTAALLLLLPPR